MKRPTLHRGASLIVSNFRSHIELPAYLLPKQTFTKIPGQSFSSDVPLFATARFRSGSTLLWQIFLRLNGFTAYYEPLNERRWFNQNYRSENVDKTHRGVTDYAVNYDDLEHLDKYFREDWTYHKLAMGKQSEDKDLKKYIQELIAAAPKRAVLQFNRIDFRLPFLKAAFPAANIIHLRRNHRDTWCSTLKGGKNNQEWTLSTFDELCRFYLLSWYRDLSLTFPFLWSNPDKTHPYEVHYLISRLSDLFARRDADIFLSYEDLDQDFDGVITALMRSIGQHDMDLSSLSGLHEPKQSGYDHTDHLAFYQALENKVEERLQQSLSAEKV